MKALVFYVETGNGFRSPAVAIARELSASGIQAEAVDLFKGTVILVSHDRAFLQDRAFTQVLSVDSGKLTVEKDYDSYLEKAMKEAERGM